MHHWNWSPQRQVKRSKQHNNNYKQQNKTKTKRVKNEKKKKKKIHKQSKHLVNCQPTDDTQEAELTSRLVNELSNEIHKKLISCPINTERKEKGLAIANCILLRGCGSCIDVTKEKEKKRKKEKRKRRKEEKKKRRKE